MRAAVPWLIGLLALACSGRRPVPPPSEEEPPSPEAQAEDEPVAAVLDPGSTCGRAQLCCRAWAEAMPSVDATSACAGPAEESTEPDAEGRCERMREGWREALSLLRADEPPPAVCAPSP